MEDYEKIELRSDDVQEILGTPPGWILSWGTTVVFLSVMALLFVSYIVKYPDIINGQIAMTTENPPVPVIARAGGYIFNLAVKDGDSVEPGQQLVLLQNTAYFDDIKKLDTFVSQLNTLDDEGIKRLQPEVNLRLGDLQLTYSGFIQALKDYQFKKNQNIASLNAQQTQQQISNMERVKRTEQEKNINAGRIVESARERFKSQQQLYSQNVISLNELQNSKKEVVSYEQEQKNIQSRIGEFDGQILQLRKGIVEVQQSSSETNNNKYVGLVENINQLKSALEKWKQQYLINAPISGKVTFNTGNLSERLNVREGEEIMYIIPKNGNGVVGLVTVPAALSGKVREGQRVIIKFDSYGYQQYGFVEGFVKSKSLMPKDQNTLAVHVDLPKGMVSNFGKTIKFDQQMQGSAEIITDDHRLIARIFEKLIYPFRKLEY